MKKILRKTSARVAARDAHAPQVREAFKRAIQLAGGTQKALADRLTEVMGRPIGQQLVSHWVKTGTLLDAEYWDAFGSVTAGGVTKPDLRPDLRERGVAA